MLASTCEGPCTAAAATAAQPSVAASASSAVRPLQVGSAGSMRPTGLDSRRATCRSRDTPRCTTPGTAQRCCRSGVLRSRVLPMGVSVRAAGDGGLDAPRATSELLSSRSLAAVGAEGDCGTSGTSRLLGLWG
jgi:hypothetical protein